MNRHPLPGRTRSPTVSAEYEPLRKYLNSRFADTLVLTFAQIEDLLGSPLPDPARRRQEWWAEPVGGDAPSTQACSWIAADRTATANLAARTVTFDRAPA